MTSNKCKKCGLVNAASDRGCRRCGEPFEQKHAGNPRSPRDAAKASSSIYTLLAVVLLGGAAVYLFNGFEHSYSDIQSNEAKRLAAQPQQTPMPLTSRAEYDQRRTEPYKNAVANSPNLAASQKHNDEVKQLVQPPSGK